MFAFKIVENNNLYDLLRRNENFQHLDHILFSAYGCAPACWLRKSAKQGSEAIESEGF